MACLPFPPRGGRSSSTGKVRRLPLHAHPQLLGIALAGWRGLDPAQRWDWFQQLYTAAAHLDARYRLGIRTGWWEDDVQVELLAALAAWVGMFDYANWTDPEGKARLLLQLPSYRELLRGGAGTFQPDADRQRFEEHLRGQRGCARPASDHEQAMP